MAGAARGVFQQRAGIERDAVDTLRDGELRGPACQLSVVCGAFNAKIRARGWVATKPQSNIGGPLVLLRTTYWALPRPGTERTATML